MTLLESNVCCIKWHKNLLESKNPFPSDDYNIIYISKDYFNH